MLWLLWTQSELAAFRISCRMHELVTLYSETFPSLIWTSCSLIQPLRILRIVSVARAMPCATASSKLFSELELISVIRATDMLRPLPRQQYVAKSVPFRRCVTVLRIGGITVELTRRRESKHP